VIVNTCGLDYEPDSTTGLHSLGFGGTDYVSAFRVRRSISPDRILDAYPSYLGTPKRVSYDGLGFPKHLGYED
jgi:hypothetical protein